MDGSGEKIKIISSLPARLQSPENESDCEDDFEPIINLQKAVYEAHIDDLQRRIERLQSRNEQIEKVCESVFNNSKYKSIEAESEFVELNIGIASETKKIDEDNKKFAELEKLRKEQKLDHLEKVKCMTENFENRRIELYSQIKELNANINTIEDYKLLNNVLRTKYKEQSESILQKEQQMQNILTEIEYKSKIHKENLKKELYKKILETSDTFQYELKSTIPLTVQRLMRENIVLQSELFRLRTDHDNMAEKLLIHKVHTKKCKKKIKEAKINTRYQIIVSKIQDLLVKKLKNAYSTVKEVLSKSYEAPEDYENKYLKLLENIKNPKYFNDDFRRRKLEVIFHQEIIKLQFTNNFKSKTSFTLQNLCNALSNLKKYISSALLISELNAEEDLNKTDLETFTFSLLDMINQCEFKKWTSDSESVETVADATSVYINGNLGFEPKHIEIDQINQRHTTTSLTHTPSTMLEEFDKLSNKLFQRKSSILSEQISLHDFDSIGTSLSSTINQSQSSKSTKELINYMNEQEMEAILDAMSTNEEGELEYELQNKYEHYLD